MKLLLFMSLMLGLSVGIIAVVLRLCDPAAPRWAIVLYALPPGMILFIGITSLIDKYLK